MSKRILATLLLVLVPNMAIADEGYNACVEVYRDSTRNLHTSFKEQAELSSYFNQHCEKNGELKASSASLNLDFAVDAIPFKFGLGGSNSKQKMQEFCKTVSTYSFAQGADYQFTNQVVVDALSNFNQCLKLASEDLIITHTIQEPESVTISGRWKKVPDGAKINHLLYDDTKLTCTSTTLTKNGKAVKVDKAQAWVIPENFSIACTRNAKTESGATWYEYATVGLSTTKGDYAIALHPNKLNGYVLASQSEQNLNQLKSDYDTLNAELQKTNVELVQAKEAYARKSSYSVILYHGNNLGFLSGLWLSNPRNFEATTCPKNDEYLNKGLNNACEAGFVPRILRGGFLDYNGGPCGNTFHEVLCERP